MACFPHLGVPNKDIPICLNEFKCSYLPFLKGQGTPERRGAEMLGNHKVSRWCVCL